MALGGKVELMVGCCGVGSQSTGKEGGGGGSVEGGRGGRGGEEKIRKRTSHVD